MKLEHPLGQEPVECLCMVCRSRVETFEIGDPPEMEMIPATQAPQENWKEAVVAVVAGKYGSKHDLGEYLIIICDDCLTAWSEQGRIPYIKDYLP